MELLLPCLYAGLGCLAFCVVFELHSWKYMLSAAFTGTAGWLVYLLLDDRGSVTRFLLSTIVIAVMSEVFARIHKSPATVFLIIGIIPLVPGGGIYYTMEALINGDMSLFVQHGLETATSAGAIAVGCSLVSSAARILTMWRRGHHSKK